MNTVTIPLTDFKAAIFDMDGTMINNRVHHEKAWQEFLRRHNITLTEEEFRQKISARKNNEIFELIFGLRPSPEDMQAYADEKEEIYRKIYKPDIKEIDGLSKIIAELHERGIKTAIATTSPSKNRDFVLETLGLVGKFEVILGDEHVAKGKPHPEIYLSTAKELGVSPDQCIVFEDSPPGVESAKKAGMTVVGILSSHSANDLHEADYMTDDYRQISFS
ncbi:MAG TPA: HAD family phosphatase [Candidatus Saccharimonadales bacterium]|nr:HAD family phosphatase [Candidatus Saccharimonadales bacterium]